MQHLEDLAKAKKFTVEVEPLPQSTNQSGTIVCGGGQMHIEVVEVPKRISNLNDSCATTHNNHCSLVNNTKSEDR